MPPEYAPAAPPAGGQPVPISTFPAAPPPGNSVLGGPEPGMAGVPALPQPPAPSGIPIPPEFQNPDGSLNGAAALQSYAHLRSLYNSTVAGHAPAPAQPPGTPAPHPGSPPGAPQPAAGAPAPAAGPLGGQHAAAFPGDDRINQLAIEFERNGGHLSPESYSEMQAQGYSPQAVSRLVAGQVALMDQQAAPLHQIVGGKENFKSMETWAVQHLTPAEAVQYDIMRQSGDPTQVDLAIRSLWQRYTSSGNRGYQPVVEGSATPGIGGVSGLGYDSPQQMYADMSKPEYHSDPAFQAKVHAKVDKSAFMSVGQIPASKGMIGGITPSLNAMGLPQHQAQPGALH